MPHALAKNHRSKTREVLRRGLVSGVAAVVLAGLLPSLNGAAVAAPADGGASPDGLWQAAGSRATTQKAGLKVRVKPKSFEAYTLDGTGMQALLNRAPDENNSASAPLEITLPAPDGSFARFAVSDSPIMEAGLAAKHPELTTYAGRGIDDPAASVRLDMTPVGFHASVRSADGQSAWYIDPYFQGDDSVYVSYFGKDLPKPKGVFVEHDADDHDAQSLKDALADDDAEAQVVRRTYRLALLTDPSYANYFGTENVLAEKVTLMNRVNQVYNDDLAVRLVLINDSDKLNLDTMEKATGANGPCGAAACFTPAQIAQCGSLSRNRIVLGQLVGAGRYDIGHLGLGVNGGGVASLGVVGGNSKAQGCTGLPQPEGDFYAVDYVAHEMGHQFSGNHTFNGTQYNCSGGNRSQTTSVEPGSGSSVMAYAGICQQDNLQPHTDPYFSQRSIQEITTYITSQRAPINEVQTVSLRDFDTDGESVTLHLGGRDSDPIVRGTNYTTAGIKAAIDNKLVNGTVTVAAFGGSGTLNDTGFQVTFNGGTDVAATNLDAMTLTFGDADGRQDATGFVGETAQGGPIQNGGFIQEQLGNHAPKVTAPEAKTIPVRTPFALTGNATDSDGEALTYIWEQNDRAGATGTALMNNVKLNGPLFRVFGTAGTVTPAGTLITPSPGENTADGNHTRVFPDMEQILANNTNAETGVCPDAPPLPPTGGASNVPAATVDCFSEFLPTVDYVGATQAANTEPSLNFRLTVRDGHANGGGTGNADVKLTLAPTAGPFLVSSRNNPGTAAVAGRGETLTWAVNGTNTPELAENVKISLSTDGGRTFPIVLAESTPNDGSEFVRWPNAGTEHARVKIEAVGNYFFDVNNADFSIVPKLIVTNTASDDIHVQHSDALDHDVTISAEDGAVAGKDLTASAENLPAGLSLEAGETSADDAVTGTRSWTVQGRVTDAPGTYPVTVTVSDTKGASETVGFTIVVEREDATVAYTGPSSVTGTSHQVKVPLTAAVQQADDGALGDLGTATVTFVDRDSENQTLCTAPVTSGSGANGSATCEFTADLGDADSADYTIGMVVDGNFVGSSGESDGTVHVDVDKTAPQTTISYGPANGSFVVATRFSVGYKSSEPGSTFRCTVDGKARACGSSSIVFDKMIQRTHVFTVAATDAAGNTDATPATRTWTVPLNDRKLKNKSGWVRHDGAKAYRGTYSLAKTKGATLSVNVSNARQVALVAGTSSKAGAVKVYLNGKLLKRVSLNTSVAKTRQVLPVAKFAKPMSGTITVVSTSAAKVRVEGLGVATALP